MATIHRCAHGFGAWIEASLADEGISQGRSIGQAETGDYYPADPAL